MNCLPFQTFVGVGKKKKKKGKKREGEFSEIEMSSTSSEQQQYRRTEDQADQQQRGSTDEGGGGGQVQRPENSSTSRGGRFRGALSYLVCTLRKAAINVLNNNSNGGSGSNSCSSSVHQGHRVSHSNSGDLSPPQRRRESGFHFHLPISPHRPIPEHPVRPRLSRRLLAFYTLL